ncbi:MAG TPA: tetratricopeptide repeat-containing glycosyltransferase family protein, partial [Pirellulales bacterium]|nr:tetratricopeptide repeat-containing glycosyltransferase family protein [Pirellulales bacterium]
SAVELKSHDAAKHYGLAVVLAKLDQLPEAVQSYRRAVALAPDFVHAYNNLGGLLMQLGRVDEAIECYSRAVALDPSFAEAYNNLGLALVRQNKLDDAMASYHRAIERKANYGNAYHNLGIALTSADRFAEAQPCYARAIEIDGDRAASHYNLAFVLSQLNEIEASAAACRRAIAIEPDNAPAHFSLATALLTLGTFAEGWGEYEWRLMQPHHRGREFAVPRWNGEPLEGKTILLVSEQGLGDTLQFIRYAPLVKARVSNLVVECPPNLARLIQRSAGVDHVISSGEPLPEFDVYAHLGSLPRIFETSPTTIPASAPYLWPEDTLVETWQGQFAGLRGLKIGIAWQGNPANPKDRFRSIPLAQFAALMRVPGIHWHSLQMGAGREQLTLERMPIVDLEDRLGDLHNTAAIMRHLDLVITCDSSAAHLAGALGMPVWVALAYAPDWRWMLDRADTPWYPTMRLFRQERPGDWSGVFNAIAAELAAFAASSG